MIVMPACSSGWIWHCLARETGRIGHLYSPGDQRGPWPWLPYACDNGAFSCWNQQDNTFDYDKWSTKELEWKTLMLWTQTSGQEPLWAIAPDVPGQKDPTLEQWPKFAKLVVECGIPPALAVQDGMTKEDVDKLDPQPAVIAVGGTTEWKWDKVAYWARWYKRVHVLRCNRPNKLAWLEELGIESCDGTGWNRGDRTQTQGVEEWATSRGTPRIDPLSPHVCRQPKQKKQLQFA